MANRRLNESLEEKFTEYILRGGGRDATKKTLLSQKSGTGGGAYCPSVLWVLGTDCGEEFRRRKGATFLL